jgi:prevent-host-death family protein
MTVTANIHEAKTTLSKLIERALEGEEVIIAKAGKPVVRLQKIEQPRVSADRLALFGKFQGKIILDENWEDSEFDADMLERFYGVDDSPLVQDVAEPPRKFKPE